MSPRFLQICETLQPAEKACWEILLHQRAGTEKIPHNSLSTAMDQTLAQLWSLLRAGSVRKWLRENQPLRPLARSGRRCALILFLPYFEAGRRALELIAKEIGESHPELSPRERARQWRDLHFAFDVLVQWQLQAVCGGCRHGKTCEFGDRKIVTRKTQIVSAADRRPVYER